MIYSNTLKTIITGIFGILVLLAVVPYGLVGPFAFGPVAIAMFALAGVAYPVFGEPHRTRSFFKFFLANIVLLSIWIVIQTLKLPHGSMSAPIWSNGIDIAEMSRESISMAPGDTLAALPGLALPGLTFLLGLIVMESDQRARSTIAAMAIASGAIAVFGLVQFFFFPHSILGADKVSYLDSLTAVFVNRNTAATFFGLGLLMLATKVFEVVRAILSAPPEKPASFKDRRRLVFYSLLSLATTVALLLTQSRAGVLSSALALGVYGLALTLGGQGGQNGTARPRINRRLLSAFTIVVLIALFFGLFAGRVLWRASVGGSDDGRFCFWGDVVRGIDQNWVYGTGFGTFVAAFPSFRTSSCDLHGIIDRAHNFYLEAFFTLGIAGPIAIGLVLVGLTFAFWRGYRNRHRLRHYAALGFAGTLLTFVHAMFDFSLQIPGYAVYFAAFAAATVSISAGGERPSTIRS